LSGTEQFGAWLRALRGAAGLSQQELADKSGLSARTIGDLERGRTRWPHPHSVLRLADALDLRGPERDEFTGALARRLAGPDATAMPRRILEPAAASDATAAGYRHGLPPDTAAFTGRDTELELIAGDLTGGAAPRGAVAIRTIGGMPGVGKTALAVHAAHLLAGTFPDRQLFVDLRGHTPGQEPVSPEDALAGLLAATGVDPRFLPADLAGRSMLWRDRLAGQRALLVLDNAASSAQVTPLLPGSGGCLVLVTSRRHLADLPGAVVAVPVDTLTPAHAREMFIGLAPRAVGETPALVGELTELAGHLPLAVTLLARVYAHHQSWTLADLIAETRGSLLTLTAEHASVAAAFDVSWRHLDPGLQRFLALLGLHPGSSTDSYATAALGVVPVEAAARVLDELHREGLLTEIGYRRYHMHDLIHSYATAQAEAVMSGAEREMALGRLIDHYTRAAARANAVMSRRAPVAEDRPAGVEPPQVPDLARSDQALAWARAERANLLACLGHATAAGWQPRVIALTAALAGLLRSDGPWSWAMARHAEAADAARRLADRPGQARALFDLGMLRRLAGDYEEAADTFSAALSIHRDLGDQRGRADVLLELGRVHGLTDEYPAEAAMAEQALEIYSSVGDQLGRAHSLIVLGSSRRRTDEFQAAAAALTQALDICRDLGDRHSEAEALRELGDVERLTGDYRAAAAHLREALVLSRDLGDRLSQARSLTWLGGVRRLTGDYQAAARDLEEALAIHGVLENRNGEANTLIWLGDLRQETGDYLAAARDLERALRIFRDLGSPAGQANALSWLGNLQRVTGDYPAAAGSLTEALTLSRSLGDRGGEATGLHNMGSLLCAQGKIDEARQCYQQALDLARQIISPWDEAHSLAGLGRCARADGDLPGASRLLRQAYQLFHRDGSAEETAIAAELDSIAEAG
jgi:tetratricopeptide (TPR) repeat protein/transcriptional regulator with XRE-family HTH domain